MQNQQHPKKQFLLQFVFPFPRQWPQTTFDDLHLRFLLPTPHGTLRYGSLRYGSLQTDRAEPPSFPLAEYSLRSSVQLPS